MIDWNLYYWWVRPLSFCNLLLVTDLNVLKFCHVFRRPCQSPIHIFFLYELYNFRVLYMFFCIDWYFELMTYTKQFLSKSSLQYHWHCQYFMSNQSSLIDLSSNLGATHYFHLKLFIILIMSLIWSEYFLLSSFIISV